ncbi:7-cyano-7-deazaguanine synthase [Defluviimonas sp. WL0050]|uniref:7-cyano-7-deazaguanine synthase n=1 Tax=Albidovulum litorale TaxID=2984134 RepID=A0ABT2ZTY3_9RHOB|nr:7-cyano-7-deazaguanine synthase [Defluviimonas sp. WL0050]MCV2874609.1 7-cyano-7-deazaguanine synthase [Defluviimonas sp. WL0050]
MPESFLIVSSESAAPKRYAIRINGSDATFRLKTDPIETSFVRSLSSDLVDLLEIASSVFFADTTVRRGGEGRQKLGAAWRRQLAFQLAVRHPELWSTPEVTAALTDAVEFLTGDRVTFEFVAKPIEPVAEPYLPLQNAPEGFQAKEVILFSGGLDSFAGALEALKDRTDNVILVTHRSAPKAINRQVTLSGYLRKEFKNRFLHLHVRATRAKSVARETTQRSRSFLFACLGYAVARIAGADRLSFYENGVVSHNLPIDAQVIETMASRTTHPLALRKLQTFLDVINEQRVAIRNDFEWLTKAEVVTKIHNLGAAPVIAHTVSCTSLRNETSEIHHCGACSQCLDRRFAILAAGLEDYDRASDYKIDVLAGARDTVRSRTMALDWTRHACQLAGADLSSFLGRFASDIVRVAQGYDTLTDAQIVEKVFDLQRRHGRAVLAVIERATERFAAQLVRHDLPTSSLLALYLGVGLTVPEVADGLVLDGLREKPGKDAGVLQSERTPLFPLRVAFFDNQGGHAIEVEGLGCVRHGGAAVAHDLKPQYEDDLAAGLAPENHNFVSPYALAEMRRYVSVNTVTQSIKRCRDRLAEFYIAIELRPPDHPLLIEQRRHKGYRLDPSIRVIRRDQVRTPAKG